MPMKHLIDMAVDRGAFICQSQSMNLFMENPNFSKLSSMHFYAWEKGLKTGMYYLRSKSATDAIKFTLSEKYQKKFVKEEEKLNIASMDTIVIDTEVKACSLDDPDCLSCGA